VPSLLLNTIALDPNRWTPEKVAFHDLADLLPAVATSGFHALEVWQYHVSRLSDEEFDALTERARSLNVTFPIVGLYPALHLEGEERAREWEAMQRLARRAEALGATVIKVFVGQFGSEEVGAAYEQSVAFARDLARVADEQGMTLTAETHPDTLCDSVPATLRFLDDVDVSNVRLCYQPFDFESTERTIADYRTLREHIIHVHLQGRRDDRMVLLERADVNYNAFLQTLAADGFDGYLCIEFVEGCVVERPEDFDLAVVLANARRDRAFVEAALAGTAVPTG
jgi:sugar phosphate isomerase/epimerase